MLQGTGPRGDVAFEEGGWTRGVAFTTDGDRKKEQDVVGCEAFYYDYESATGGYVEARGVPGVNSPRLDLSRIFPTKNVRIVVRPSPKVNR